MLIATVTLVAGCAAFALLLWPRIRTSSNWTATVTPLASIIGSGFLVSVPLLAHTVGKWAIAAMAGLMVLAYAVGGVIRYNIGYAEDLLKEEGLGSLLASVERMSLLTLVFAYIISASYYLTLFSVFLLKAFGHPDPLVAKLITTGLLTTIAVIGTWRGLQGLERVEIYTVSLNLAVIAGLLCALAAFNMSSSDPTAGAVIPATSFDWHTVTVVIGLLIVVQGFETSKFLGDAYDAPTRISTMRRAQWISSIIYLLFFALITPLMPLLGEGNGVTAIIDLVAHVAIFLPFAVVFGALASQFSASVADSIGASGLLHDASDRRIAIRHTYPLIGLVGAAIVWETHVTELITLASRAFALFYASQCLVAIVTATRTGAGAKRVIQIAGFAAIAAICLFIVFFGEAADV